MRRRVFRREPAPSNGPWVEVRRINAARLVTLEDPNGPTTLAQDAFARLRPPEGTDPETVASWREAVSRVARAVRVVPPPKAALVPAASDRSDNSEHVGTVREEATRLAAETENEAVIANVKRILDEVDA